MKCAKCGSPYWDRERVKGVKGFVDDLVGEDGIERCWDRDEGGKPPWEW